MNTTGQFDLEMARTLVAACGRTYAAATPEERGVDTPLAHARIRSLAAGELASTRLAQAAQAADAGAARPEASGTKAESGTACRIVALRGSQSLRDWVTDFEFQRRNAGGGEKLHYGFASAWTNLRPALLDALAPDFRDASPSSTPLLITGHSLGGALAMLAAEGLFKEGFPIGAVYTFGAPRVGNAVWAAGYDLLLRVRTWRVVDELDVVPRVPLLGYRHAGRCALLEETPAGEMACRLEPGWWRMAAADAWAMWRAWQTRRLGQIEDHPVGVYAARLGAVKPEEVLP